jgi:nucleotide-binding universal stress UspA family protein
MPVWLARPRPIRPGGMRVGVAVDPLAPGLAAWGLALRMLRMGHELSRLGAFPLQVVSCWTYEYEAYLDRNPWFLRMDAAELQAAVRDADDDHCAALDRLLQEAGIDGPLRVNRIHGTAASRVPAFVEDSDLDVLLMGTSNKAGLRALLMGRAAEGILQSLRCSVLAFKPDESVPPGTRRP